MVYRTRQGFTLIELLLVIGIIAILASIIIVAINPSRELGDAHDATRVSDVNLILTAVYQYAVDHGNTLPAGIPTTRSKFICQSNVAPAECDQIGGVNLRMLSGSYLPEIPRDPLLTLTATGTRYTISQDDAGKLTVTAPSAERMERISVSR